MTTVDKLIPHTFVWKQKKMIDDLAQFLTDELGVYVEPMLVLDGLEAHNYVLTELVAA